MRISFLFLMAAVNVPVVYYRLPNGLRVVISETHAAPAVTVAVDYGVGLRIEPKGQTGFAHLVERMTVASSGGRLTGSTRFDFTNYFVTVRRDQLEAALTLQAERMRSLDVNEENLANFRKAFSEEVRTEILNQPYHLFEWLDIWQNANENWFNAHRFYGDLHDVEAAKPDDVRKFFKTYYAPNDAVLAVVGDVESAAVRTLIEKHFAQIPLQSVPERPDVNEPQQTKEKRLEQTDKLAKVPALAFAYHLPDQESSDYSAVVLLDQILQRRFDDRLVSDKAISIDWRGGINFELGNQFDYDGPMLMVSRTTYKAGHTGAEILKEVDVIVRNIQEHGVTKRELDDAKARFRANFYDQLESTSEKANLLASFALFHDNPERISKVVPACEAVTAGQVQAAARKYLTPENRTAIDHVPDKDQH